MSLLDKQPTPFNKELAPLTMHYIQRFKHSDIHYKEDGIEKILRNARINPVVRERTGIYFTIQHNGHNYNFPMNFNTADGFMIYDENTLLLHTSHPKYQKLVLQK